VRAAFGENTYRRLRTIKGQYDPDNVFRSNHNILPPERTDMVPLARHLRAAGPLDA
jgi:hypothetical protein